MATSIISGACSEFIVVYQCTRTDPRIAKSVLVILAHALWAAVWAVGITPEHARYQLKR
jgi:hypothetical protein